MKAAWIAAPAALLGLAACGPKAQKTVDTRPVPTGQAATDLRFADATAEAGIDFVHNNGAFGAKLMPESMGSGLAFLDCNGDGWQDLYVVNSRDWTPAEVEEFRKGSGRQLQHLIPASLPRRGGTGRLYLNQRDGTFKDVTQAAGLAVPLYGMGATVGDYDNDGDADLFVTALDRCFLFRNDTPAGGAPRFTEAASQAGVKGDGWSTSAAFVDYDKDGDLDLFVCRYVDWSPGTDIYCSLDGKQKSYCVPESYNGQESRLYQNLGGGRFADVSRKAGILAGVGEAGRPRKLQGKSLGVSICDYDTDGWPDIVVANDTEPNYLFRNKGDGTFTEVGVEAGIAYSEGGQARAAMGVDAADIDRSGRESLLFGNFSNQMLGLYRNRGNGLFIDVAPTSEVGPASLQFLAFGACFLDVDNDGWLDMLTANGHLEPEIGHVQQTVAYEERPLLFRNLGQGRFTEIGAKCGESLKTPLVGRGLAYADYDLDGDLDIAISTNGGRLRLYRNDGGSRAGAVRVVLAGSKSNRSGIGAVVECRMGSEVERRSVRSGSSYCSQSELPLTLGMGGQAKIDLLTVRWPSGTVTEAREVAAGSVVTVDEEKGVVSTAPFAPARRRARL